MSEDDAPVQALMRVCTNVMPMPGSDDRRANFIIAADYIKDGTILLRNKGCEELIRQMLNYDVESNTELVDAFSYLVLGVIRESMTKPPSPGWSAAYDPPGAGYG
jgi:hypothetical protein